MTTLRIDLETFSSVDLRKAGMHRYVESIDFEVMLFAYAFDAEPVQVIDLVQGESIPPEVETAIFDSNVIKTAYNAAFELACLGRHFGRALDPMQWRCTSVHALYLGLPGNLADVGKVVGLPEDQQKKRSGSALIRYFCIPCKPTKANMNRTRNKPIHDREKWRLFKDYCAGDVVAEREIANRLAKFPVPDKEQRLWVLDQKMNNKGVTIDRTLVEAAIECDQIYKQRLMNEAIALTGLSNPNSRNQLLAWLIVEDGTDVEDLTKKTVPTILKNTESDVVHRVMELRQQLAKTSVSKYHAMQRSACADAAVRGMTQFYGANRTGRWCLAEGSPVLVKDPDGRVYEKAIEEVSRFDKVWDGIEWVEHEGVVFSGDKEVITWDGVTATPEHVVWVSESEKMPLGEAVSKGVLLWRGRDVHDL